MHLGGGDKGKGEREDEKESSVRKKRYILSIRKGQKGGAERGQLGNQRLNWEGGGGGRSIG